MAEVRKNASRVDLSLAAAPTRTSEEREKADDCLCWSQFPPRKIEMVEMKSINIRLKIYYRYDGSCRAAATSSIESCAVPNEAVWATQLVPCRSCHDVTIKLCITRDPR